MTEGTGRSASRGGRHTCATCAVSYTNRHNLERHVREKHGGQSHVCEQCGATFPRRYRLEAHVATHVAGGAEKFRCTLCPATASTRAGLARHVRCHAAENGAGTACPDCGVMFKHYWLMKLHRKHHASARLSCPICARLFRYRSHMLEHLRTHDTSSFSVKVAQKTKRSVLAALGQKPADDGVGLRTTGERNQDGPRVSGKTNSCQEIELRVLEGKAGIDLDKCSVVNTCATLESLSPGCGIPNAVGAEHRSKPADMSIIAPASRNVTSQLLIPNSIGLAMGKSSRPNQVVTFPPPILGLDIDASATEESLLTSTSPLLVDNSTSSDISDGVDSFAGSLGEKLHVATDFGDEKRPLTLEDAVRELAADSQRDPSMQVEFAPDFSVGQDLLGAEPVGADFTFATGSDPVQDLHSNLSDGQELGFELEVDTVDSDHLVAGSRAFGELPLGGGCDADELQLELDIGGDSVVKDLGLVPDVSDPRIELDFNPGSDMRGLTTSSTAQDVELELDAADLEGELGAGLAEWLGQGIRVEVEESSRVGETVMVITLVDE